jgi:hypothetical protein
MGSPYAHDCLKMLQTVEGTRVGQALTHVVFLARWAGITLGDARAAWGAAPVVTPAPLPPPRLLGGFEELLLGWVDRSWVLGENKGVVTMNGIFKPIALARGQAVATWGMPRGKVALDPFAPLSASAATALAQDAAEVERFLAG